MEVQYALADTSPQQALPTELLNLVFRQIDDDAFVWVVCRQLSRRLRAEVDFSFRSRQLKQCTIYWPLSGLITTSPLLARLNFSHVSDDGDIAYFRVSMVVNSRSGKVPNFRDFEVAVAAYGKTKNTQKINKRGERQFGSMPVTRIGVEPNNTYMTDIALPALQTHAETQCVSFDWKALFYPIYRERYRVSVLRAANTVTSPSMLTLPLERPIVIAASLLRDHQHNRTEDFSIRMEVCRHRYRHLAPPDEQRYGFASRETFLFWKSIDDQLKNLDQYRDSVRLRELIAAYGLQWVENEYGGGWVEALSS
jgi:hypothetical protein